MCQTISLFHLLLPGREKYGPDNYGIHNSCKWTYRLVVIPQDYSQPMTVKCDLFQKRDMSPDWGPACLSFIIHLREV